MSASVEEVLGEAAKLEKEYEWLQASGLYEQALGMVDEGDYFRRCEVQEKIARADVRIVNLFSPSLSQLLS